MAGEPAQPSERSANPYVGPRPFGEDDEPRFHGREREASDVLSLVIAHRAVLLYAQSGAGKSSLVRARVVPALRRRGYDILPVARVGGVPNRGTAPNMHVSNTVEYWGVKGAGSLRAALDRLRPAIDSRGAPAPRVAVFDQFEELFTAYPERFADRQTFLEEISDVLEDNAIARVLFVMREDYLASLTPYEDILPEELRTRYRLERLQKDAALIAVETPAADAGVPFERGAADELVADLLRTPRGSVEFVEPVQLQVVCYTLFERLPASTTQITREHLRSFGDVDQALQNYYIDGIRRTAALTGVPETVLREWFDTKLITEGQTRGMSFRGASSTDGVPNAAVDALASQHLIAGEMRPDGTLWYELSHDRFIEPIRKANEGWRERRIATRLLTRSAGALAVVAILSFVALLVYSQRRALAVKDREIQVTQREMAAQARQKDEAERIAALERERGLAKDAEARARAREYEAEQQRAELERQQGVRERDTLNALASAHAATRPDLAALISVEAIREHPANLQARTNLLTALQSSPRLVMYLRDHTDQVNRAKYSPDDTLIASASRDGSIVLWDSGTGRPALRPLLGHEGPVADVAFSPDGSWLASAGNDMTVRTWSVATGLPLGLPLRGHRSWVESVAVSPDGTRIASGSADGTVRLWDVKTRSSEILPSDRPNDEVKTVAFAPDGQTIAWATANGTVCLWDVGRRRALRPPLRDITSQVWKVAFSPDGSILAACSSDRTLRMWRTPDYRPIGRPIAAHADSITSLAFSPDSTVLASAAADRLVRLWNTADGTPIGSPLSGHSEPILSVDFNSDGTKLVTAGVDKTAAMWDLSLGELRQRVGYVEIANAARLWAVAYSPDGRIIATGGDDARLGLWDAISRKRLGVPLEGHTGAVTGVAFSPDGALVASCSMDGTVRLWHAGTGYPAADPMKSGARNLFSVAFSPIGGLIAAGSGEGTVDLWDLADRKPVAQFKVPSKEVYSVAFTADGRRLAAGDSAGIVRTWDVDARREIEPALSGLGGEIRAVAFVPDTSLLVAAGTDKRIVTWDLRARSTPPRTLAKLDRDIYALALSRDHRIVFAGTATGTARVRLSDGKEAGPDLGGHRGAVFALAVSPTDALASASSDGTVLVWDLVRGHPAGASIRGHAYGVHTVAFDPTADRLAVGGPAGTVFVMDRTNGSMTMMDEPPSGLYRLGFTSDGTTLVAAGCTKAEADKCTEAAIEHWDAHTGKRRGPAIKRVGTDIISLAVHPREPLLISGAGNGDVDFWDERSGQPSGSPITKAHSGAVRAIAVTLDGRLLATGGEDMTIRLWDLRTRRPIGAPLKRHDHELRSLAFNRDGTRLASSSRDRNVIIWDVSRPATPVAKVTLSGHDGSVQSVAFTPDGHTLVSGSVDSTVRLWDVATGKPIGTLHGHTADVESVAVNSNGTWAISGGRDGFVWAWALDTESWRASACSVVQRNLEPAEWERYFQGRTPRAVCPEVSVREADALALRGEKSKAAHAFAQAVKEAAETRNPELMNEICWYGTLGQVEAAVRGACDAALQLAPRSQRGLYADSHGVAAAVRGDYAVALRDFKAFLQWAGEHEGVEESMLARRREWVKALEGGNNPLTPAVLEMLRRETVSSR